MNTNDQLATVLVIDDDQKNLQLVSEVLTKAHYRVLVAKDGLTGIDRAQKAHPDIILLDVMMPGIDGFETCARLKGDENTRKIPIIFLTALDGTESKVIGFHEGGVDYVTKPIHADELTSRVATHTRIYHLARELCCLNQHLEDLVAQRTQKLADANRRVLRLDQAKTTFIELAAHEFRTPLTVMKGYIDLLAEQAVIQENETLNTMVLSAGSGAVRMERIVSSLLDMASISAGLLSLQLEEIPADLLFAQLIDIYERPLGERNIIVETHSDTPSITADPVLFHKAFVNLFENAIKFTPDGGKITLAVTQAKDPEIGACVELQIRDTGIGIDPKDFETVFETFNQAGDGLHHGSGNTEYMTKGPGMGLPIARGIIEAHGGRLMVSSDGYDPESMPGSTFSVLMPLNPSRNGNTGERICLAEQDSKFEAARIASMV
jgi:two-component system sensor histidine kinase/response regulator